MLNIPESLRNILKQDYLPYHAPVEKSLVLYFADLGLTITDEDFTDGDSFSLEDSLCGDELTFGDCGSACLKFKVDNIIEDLVGKKFTAKFVIENTDIKLGTFIVTEAKKEDNDTTKSIVAYDLMYLFNKDVLSWYESLTFPTYLKRMRESLCDYCGVECAPLPTSQGSAIKLNSNYNSKMELLELQGKSVQNGTPTPEVPVAIQSVGDNGNVIGKITGKNVLPRTAKTATTINGITFTPNSDGSITANGTATALAQFQLVGQNIILNGTYTWSGCPTGGAGASYNLGIYTIIGGVSEYPVDIGLGLTKTYSGEVYIKPTINIPAGVTANNLVFKPQLEIGKIVTQYEPYKEQLVTIPLTQPLRSVGSVYDRGCVKSGGLWGNERKFGYVVLDGSADEWWTKSSLVVDGYTSFYLSIPTSLGSNTVEAKFINNIFQTKTYYDWTGLTKSEFIENINKSYGVRILSSRLATQDLAGFRAWLASNPLKVIYELETPVFEPFPQAIQDQLNKLQTYDGTTNIFTTDALQPNMTVEYNYLPNDTMTVEKTISTNILNGREVLSKCEELNGCFGHMNRDGKLDHIVLSKSNPVEIINGVSYDSLKFEEYTTDVIDKVQIRTEDGDIGAYVGTGTNCYSVTANYLVYGKTAASLSTICTNLSTSILGVTYRPYESDMQGLPYLDIGDYITFEGNEIANTYIMQRTLSGTQILADKVSAKGSKTLSEDNNINVQMEQMKGKTNVLTRDVEKMESTITEFDKQITVLLPGPWYPDGSLLPCQNNMTNLEYELNSKILQTAKEITTEVNNVSEQLNTKITQTATSITAQVNNLSANMSAQFAITDAEISTKVEKNGVISAINQTAESITINASKINLTGYATFSGLESGTTVINGGCIKTGSIDAERIKAGKLNGMTLSGANIDCYMLKSSSSSSSYTELTAGNLEVYTAGYRTSIDGTGISIKGRSVLCYGDSVSSVATSYLTLSGGTLVADNGSLYIGQNTVKANTITQTSSRKLKKYIKNFKESALDIINKTEVKTYLYKNENKSHKRHVGVIMEDVNEIIVNQEKSGIDIGAMTSLSWKAIQELEDRICKLEQT